MRTTLAHITISADRDRIDAICLTCGEGVNVGLRFGSIDGEAIVAEWMKRHAHKPKGD